MLALAAFVHAQEKPSATVDAHGVMRWSATGAEVALYGVNYTTPFAHSFRALQRLNIPWSQAIDADVYHFARLGLDAYRVHVWDREVSDAEGNLLVNEHIEAFDYLLSRLEERGIKIVLTPLQFGDAGYPEPGQPLPGFSRKYGKRGCLEDRAAWPLQERYLAQFVSHVNPRTGVAYKDDPNILAFEICNEPGHFEYAPTLEYINRMVQAIRDTGCAKPIFYNMSHGLPVHGAYLDANVQGGTFQWYPSNLVAGHEQRGNFLPYVDRYPIPFADDPRFKQKAKLAYEFDAADIGRSYLYPAMARSFRTAGMQFATQFAYDSMYLAPFNTEYQTHYMNLAYAPSKAIGLKVAGEAFRRVPLGRSYGNYPENTDFAGVHVSYTDDLAELVTAKTFFYSNTTASVPPHPEQLEEVAGVGSSPVVSYPGTGAYFLDRLEAGVWRLEVMPDAIWVRDPFEKPKLGKQVCRISWGEWAMSLKLPDLGSDFDVVGLNDGNATHGRSAQGTIPVHPGAYLLTRDGVTSHWKPGDRWRNLTLKEFVAPPASIDRTYVLHHPTRAATAGRSLKVAARIVAPTTIDEARLVFYAPETYASEGERPAPPGQGQPGRGNTPGPGAVDLHGAQFVTMEPGSAFAYTAVIPAVAMQVGILRYDIAIRAGGTWTSFPSGVEGLPTDWDFYGAPWTVRVVPPRAPVLLFDAGSDTELITANGRDERYPIVPSDRPGIEAMKMVARGLDRGEHDESFRFFFRDTVGGRAAELTTAKKLVLYGRSDGKAPCKLQLALETADGIAYGATVDVGAESGRYTVSVDALHQVRSPNIPHGYPVFIPFWSDVAKRVPLDLGRSESVLVSIGPGLKPADYRKPHAVLIERIWLE